MSLSGKKTPAYPFPGFALPFPGRNAPVLMTADISGLRYHSEEEINGTEDST